MGTSKTNISKINKYVKGRLNAPDMHQLERETYEDAFLNEAMEGYEELAQDDHEKTLADLKTLLHKRAAKEKRGRLIMWRMLPIAASVMIMLGAGYWFFKPEPVENQSIQTKSKNSKSQIAVSKKAAPKITPKERKLTADVNIEPMPIKEPESVLKEVVIAGNPSIKYKTDTVEYIASDYKVRKNASVDEMLKKAEGFEVGTDGSLTFNGTAVSKARLNGKDYSGGDVAQAIQSLPADIIEKLQVVDDYGDQAGRTGIKSGDATKVLNLTTSTDKNKFSASGYFMSEPIFYSPQVIYKTDTIEYVTNNYPIQNEAKIIHVINRLPGFELDSSLLYFQAKLIKKIKINGKENRAKDMLEVTRKLPADILEEVQVIDDYGDVAGITSIKTGEPEKIINLVVRDIKNRRLPWAIDRRGVLMPGDTIAKPKPAIGWKKYSDYVRSNAATADKLSDEIMVFFYVAPDGTISNIQAVSYSSGIQYAKAISIIKNGPRWLGYSEPRQVWLKVRLPKK